MINYRKKCSVITRLEFFLFKRHRKETKNQEFKDFWIIIKMEINITKMVELIIIKTDKEEKVIT